MAFVINFFKGVRNHSKKSAFAAVAITYGVNRTKDYYDTNVLMRDYCERAAKFGHVPIAVNENPRTVTVILNPNADRRKAAKNFEKYCAPILHLAGICIDIVQTESEGHAKTLVDTLGYTDAIVVAGGDGTLSEVVTGLLRRSEKENTVASVPVGILPLGRNSKVGRSFFPGGESLTQVRSLADASLAVVRELTKPVDVMKIELLDENEAGKAVYALGGLEWGAFRDAEVKTDKYWYFGPLRSYVTYLFNGYKKNLNWSCEATLNYSAPCSGCSNCYRKPPESGRRWYHVFIPFQRGPVSKDYSKIENAKCAELHEAQITTTNFGLFTSNVAESEEVPKLKLHLGPEKIKYFDFVSQGWKFENGEPLQCKEVIEAKQIVLKPAERFNKVQEEDSDKKKNEHFFYIDKEEFDVTPIRITLLPKAVRMFCKEELPS